MSDKEIEFKFAVKSPNDFDRLLKHLQLGPRDSYPKRQQLNHFFDTRGRRLQNAGMILRLREEEGRQYLTHKASSRALTTDQTASERVEVQVSLTPAEALGLLHGQTNPLDLLRQRAAPENSEAVDALQQALGGEPTRYIGHFKNYRRVVPSAVISVDGQPERFTMELDQTSFAPAEHEYELEVELGSPKNVQAQHDAWVQTLGEAGVSWQSAESKSARFFRRIPNPSNP